MYDSFPCRTEYSSTQVRKVKNVKKKKPQKTFKTTNKAMHFLIMAACILLTALFTYFLQYAFIGKITVVIVFFF